HLGYADPRGSIELRRSIAEYLQAARAVRADPEHIVVTAGTQQAIDIAIRVLLAPGDRVWAGGPGYFLTRRQLMLANASLQPIPVDSEGLRVDIGIAAAPWARAAFVTPSHQFPPASCCRWHVGWPCSHGRARPAPSSSRTTTPVSS